MPGLGSTGGKFQLSAGWRYASADRSYFNSRYNRSFTELWGPKIRLSTLDVTALYKVNNRVRLTGTLPVVFNNFSTILPPLGIDQGARRGFGINGVGDLSLYGQSFVLNPSDIPSKTSPWVWVSNCPQAVGKLEGSSPTNRVSIPAQDPPILRRRCR
ncbi:MAG: hypothetical protein R3C24_13905 [Cyanobacteriota/Melainabacteria group bacterium]